MKIFIGYVRVGALALLSFAFAGTDVASASTFNFRLFTNGAVLDNQPSDTVVDGDTELQIDAFPSGGIFNVTSAGMGVDTSGISNVSDGDVDKISIPGGTNPGISGITESVQFSFDRDGILQHLFLDGIKDENLEYAILTLPDSSVMTFFDHEVPLRLAEQGFELSDLTAPNINLLQEFNGDDDEAPFLNIPYLAGETFTLSFGVEPAPERTEGSETITYVPSNPQAPNGFRLQLIEVVPEPSSVALLIGMCLLIGSRKNLI